MLQKILVLVRGHDASQAAVRRALSLASASTEILLLDVVYEPLLEGYLGNTEIYAPLRARLVAERKDHVNELAATLRKNNCNATGEAVWDRPLDEAVAKRVRTLGIDCVVVAPAGAPGSGLSNSDWRLVTTCPAPILVAQAPAERQYRHIVAAVDPERTHGKPADLDLAILEQARELTARTQAKLAVLHCFTPLEYFGADLKMPPSRGPGPDGRHEALDALMGLAGLPAASARLEKGAPHEVIEWLATRGEADVVVMGALARGRVKDWMIGSTAERVLHAGRVDVLAVKPAHRRWDAETGSA